MMIMTTWQGVITISMAMLGMKRFVKCLFELLTQHRLFFPR